MPLDVKISMVDSESTKPLRFSQAASGYDVAARERRIVKRGTPTLVPLGFRIQTPAGWEAQIRPRSGSSMIGLSVVFGTIDGDYRGEVCAVVVYNGERAEYCINPGQRIAQLVIAPVFTGGLEFVTELDSTARGEGGFGSTGK